MLNSGLSALIMVGGTIYAVFQLNTLKQFPSTLIEMISVYLPLVISFVISIGPISAASISMEAKNLWLMQSLPVSPLQVLTQKLKTALYCKRRCFTCTLGCSLNNARNETG